MRTITLCVAAMAAMSVGALALAQDAQKPDQMQGNSMAMAMPKPGDESKALGKFFDGTFTWTGKLEAGAMGADSKEATTHGKATCRPVLGGFWYSCDYQETMGAGKQAMTWKGHMIVGYDTGTKTYRSVAVDNAGVMGAYNGTLDGEKFVLETPTEIMMMGQSMKDRLTWDMSDGTMKFTDEHQMTGGEWKVAESATVKRVGGGMKGSTARVEGMGMKMKK